MKHWKEEYEDASAAEEAKFARMPIARLLDVVRHGKRGDYYGIWRVIATHPASHEICWTLYDFLLGDSDYLDRYHCADALLAVLGCEQFEAVQLSAEWPEVKTNLVTLRSIVEKSVGAR